MKKLVLTALIAGFSASSMAQGIPTIDKEALLQWAASLEEAEKRLEQLKNTYSLLKDGVNADAIKALLGQLNFADLGEIEGAYKDLLNGKPSELLKKAANLLDTEGLCQGVPAASKEMCQNASLGSVLAMSFTEKMQNEIKKELKALDDLAKKAQSAAGGADMQQIQAQLQIHANKIALMQQQESNFYRLQKAQAAMFMQQQNEARAKEIEDTTKRMIEEAKSSQSKNNTNTTYNDLLTQ